MNTTDFTLWVDADAAPAAIKEIVFRASLRLSIPTVLVANHRVGTPANNPLVTSVLVAKGDDVADLHIAEEAEPGDLAVTADIPLAAALVDKGIQVIDPRGDEYTKANIGERLSIRDFMATLRDQGVETGGPSSFGASDRHAFAGALDRILQKRMRRRR